MTKVIVNGTFDILHLGHINLLQNAKSYPNAYVLVLIDSDKRVKQLKGANRPVHSEYERASMLFALKAVDRVEIFDTDKELIEFIKNFNPDVMVKGSDYQGQPIIGADLCGRVEFFERINEYSTTKTIQRIVDR
jgi:D-beta-D-heptose 7-phosphate kinase/D-beta-D-heptose 1-phosphate adenosyltransferase